MRPLGAEPMQRFLAVEATRLHEAVEVGVSERQRQLDARVDRQCEHACKRQSAQVVGHRAHRLSIAATKIRALFTGNAADGGSTTDSFALREYEPNLFRRDAGRRRTEERYA